MGKLTRNQPRISPIPEDQICCEAHKDSAAEFFCCHCQKSICDYCTSDRHFNHTFQSLDKILEQFGKPQLDVKIMCDKSVVANVKDIERTMAAMQLRSKK